MLKGDITHYENLALQCMVNDPKVKDLSQTTITALNIRLLHVDAVRDVKKSEPFPLNVLLLLKDQTFIFYLLLQQLALCRVAALKSLPVQHP